MKLWPWQIRYLAANVKLRRLWWRAYARFLKRCPDCKHRLSFSRGYPYCGRCDGN